VTQANPWEICAIRALRNLFPVAEDMGTRAAEAAAPADLTVERLPADALAAAKTLLPVAEAVAIAHAERERIIAEAQATARNIVAEAERAAQDIVARAVKIKVEADRALDDAKSKAVCIQKRAQAALALAENIAEGRRLIDALGD
jgi:hypothetical protein